MRGEDLNLHKGVCKGGATNAWAGPSGQSRHEPYSNKQCIAVHAVHDTSRADPLTSSLNPAKPPSISNLPLSPIPPLYQSTQPPSTTNRQCRGDLPPVLPDEAAEGHHQVGGCTAYDSGEGPQEEGGQQATSLPYDAPRQGGGREERGRRRGRRGGGHGVSKEG